MSPLWKVLPVKKCPSQPCFKATQSWQKILKSMFSCDLINHLFLAEVEAKMMKESTEAGVVWKCTDCGHHTKFRTSLFEHVESKHVESSGYICQYCQKFCRTRNALRSHVNRVHSVKNTDNNLFA